MDYENRVRQLEIDHAVLRTKVDALTSALDSNTQAMKNLTAVVSQGKGAWIAIGAISGVLAFIINFAVSLVKG